MKPDRFYLEIAMKEAEHAYNNETYPVGAVIIDPYGDVMSRGHNKVYIVGDLTAHAEMEAIRAAGKRLIEERNRKRCTLYTTLEPCLMCCGAILQARIARVVWLNDDPLHGALRCLHAEEHPLSDFYVEKLCLLQFRPTTEPDLTQRMEHWMEHWNNAKEIVLNYWRQGE